jgi:hypothetical protein
MQADRSLFPGGKSLVAFVSVVTVKHIAPELLAKTEIHGDAG